MRHHATGALATLAGLGLLALVVWLSEPRQTFETLARLAPWQATVLVLTTVGGLGGAALYGVFRPKPAVPEGSTRPV